eukprot:NODE_579_length_6479_cov_0.371160.p1 type:complete len:586 gc:universal NODE_579_length_6479_cov_0.371160:5811-4054(-)
MTNFLEEQYIPRILKSSSKLPVKKNGKWIYHSDKESDTESVSAIISEIPVQAKQPVESTPDKPNMILMAQLANEVMSKPETNFKLLHTLRELIQHPELSLKEQQLGLLTLCRVYMDVLPEYRIREYSEIDLSSKLKKDVKSLRNFEHSILQQYQLYLKYLHSLIDSGFTESKTCKVTVTHTAIKCLQQLIYSKPNFNFRKNIIQVLCNKGNHGSYNLSDCELLCIETLIELIKRDNHGLISLEITQFIVQILNKRNFKVHEDLLSVLSNLTLTERAIEQKIGSKRKARNSLSRKQKKHYKKEREVEKEMKEAEATYNNEEQAQFQQQILEALFQILFKILKKADPECRLIYTSVMLIGQFGHLVSLEIVPSVFSMLREIALNSRYTLNSRIACGHAAKMLLFRGSDELSLDLTSFFIAYYQLLDDLVVASTSIIEMYLTTLSDLLWRTRITTSPERVAAFLKKLAMFILNSNDEDCCLAILFMVRLFMTSYPKCMQMIENDSEKVFAGIYNPLGNEPDASCSLSANLWEISNVCMNHYSQHVRQASLLLMMDLRDMCTMDVVVNKPDPKNLKQYFKSSTIANIFK